MDQSEIAQSSIRGRLTTLQQLFLGIGSLVASWVGYACNRNYENGLQWRLPLGLQLMPAVPLCCCILLFPESPRWLASKGRNEEALQALARLHAHGNIEDPLVTNEFKDILRAMQEEDFDGNALKALFTRMYNFRPRKSGIRVLSLADEVYTVLLGIALQFSMQMTGVSVLQYYSP